MAKLYTYGLSFFVFIPWTLGAPIGHVSNELVIELMLEERATGTVLWHKSYAETKEATAYGYWMPPEFYYDKLFALIMGDVVKSLRAELPAMFSGTTDDSPTSSRSLLPN
jgi:hypothetical protein